MNEEQYQNLLKEMSSIQNKQDYILTILMKICEMNNILIDDEYKVEETI